MKDRSIIITIATIASILLVAAGYVFFVVSSNEDVTSDAARSLSATDQTSVYTDLDGNPVSLKEYNGRVRVVNSWATWCPFCATELKDFAVLAGEYPKEDVVVIAINRAEPNALAKQFVSKISNQDNLIFVQDQTDFFYESIAGFAMPETIFYDREGNVVFHKRGSMKLAEMQKHTEAALSQTE